VSANRRARNVNGLLDAELNKAMKSLLDDEEYENFLAAATRLSKTAQAGIGGVVGGVVSGAPGIPVGGVVGGIVVR
jgi:hypothetical protein